MTPARAVLLAVLLTPLALVAMAKYVIIDVHEAGPDGTRLWIPVPIAAAQAALHFAPEHARQVRHEELTPYLPLLRSLTKELKKVRAAELLRVEEKDQRVLISISDGVLVVDVLSADEAVRVRLAFEVFEAAFGNHDGGELEVSGVLSALKAASGDLVDVSSRGNRVRISVW